MTKGDIKTFKRLFDDWASADVQMRTKNGDFGDGTQHQFIDFLLSRRAVIISAVELTAAE